MNYILSGSGYMGTKPTNETIPADAKNIEWRNDYDPVIYANDVAHLVKLLRKRYSTSKGYAPEMAQIADLIEAGEPIGQWITLHNTNVFWD